MICPICNYNLSKSDLHEGVFICQQEKKVKHIFMCYFSLSEPDILEDYYIEVSSLNLNIDGYPTDNETHITFNKNTIIFSYIDYCDALELFNKIKKMYIFT